MTRIIGTAERSRRQPQGCLRAALFHIKEEAWNGAKESRTMDSNAGKSKAAAKRMEAAASRLSLIPDDEVTDGMVLDQIAEAIGFEWDDGSTAADFLKAVASLIEAAQTA